MAHHHHHQPRHHQEQRPPSYSSQPPAAADATPAKHTTTRPSSVERHRQNALPRRPAHTAYAGQHPPPSATRRPSSGPTKELHRGGANRTGSRVNAETDGSFGDTTTSTSLAPASTPPHVMQDLGDPERASSRSYQRHPAGTLYSIALTNRGQIVRTDIVASEWVLVTRAIVSQHRAAKQCVHFSRNGTCQRGNQCSFVHLAPPPLMQPPVPPALRTPNELVFGNSATTTRHTSSTATAGAPAHSSSPQPARIPRPSPTAAHVPPPPAYAPPPEAFAAAPPTTLMSYPGRADPPPPLTPSSPLPGSRVFEAQGHNQPPRRQPHTHHPRQQRQQQPEEEVVEEAARAPQQQQQQRPQRFRHAAYDATPVSLQPKRGVPPPPAASSSHQPGV